MADPTAHVTVEWLARRADAVADQIAEIPETRIEDIAARDIRVSDWRAFAKEIRHGA